MKKQLILIPLFFLLLNTQAKINVAITSFCNAGNRITSVDNYHSKIASCFNGISKSNIQFKALSIVNDNTCDMTGLKSKALSFGASELITGIYYYSNGIIELDIEIINMHEVGKRTRLTRFSINPKKMDEGLNKIVVALAKHFSVSLNDYQPCYKPIVIPKPIVAKVIKTKIKEKPITTKQGEGYSPNTITAFDHLKNGKIDKALAYFDLVEKSDNTYYDVQYHMGLCYMLQGNFSMAKNQFTKVETFGNTRELKNFKEYQKANKVGTIPYLWFDTQQKRENWYNTFNKVDKTKIIKILNKMGVNNGVFDEKYTYKDRDIKALLESSYTPIELGSIDDFTFMKNLNNTTVLELHNTSIKSIKGLSFLYKLHIIRTNKKIKNKRIKNWLIQKKIKIVYF